MYLHTKKTPTHKGVSEKIIVQIFQIRNDAPCISTGLWVVQ